jgi:hypothetical protein
LTNATDKTLPIRLALRRAALDQWLKDVDLRVLDLGAGPGMIWETLSTERRVAVYCPVDKKPQFPGTLKYDVTPATLGALDPARYNVIDFDTFTSPWESWGWLALLIQWPTLVVLTDATTAKSGPLPAGLKPMVGIRPEWKNVPSNPRLLEYAGRRALLKGANLAHVKDDILTFGSVARVSGYAIFCPGRATQLT